MDPPKNAKIPKQSLREKQKKKTKLKKKKKKKKKKKQTSDYTTKLQSSKQYGIGTKIDT